MNHTNKIKLMSHLIYGYPNVKTSFEIARAMEKGGASLLEIQLPFSDPIADGATIIEACQKALAAPKRIKEFLEFIKKVSASSSIPVVIMSYANPVFHFGITKFIKEAARAGASGVIIPDLPFDSTEGKELIRACKKYGLYPILVLSPGISVKRIKEIIQNANGFIYCTSRQGTTGANSSFDTDLGKFIRQLRKLTHLPIAIGFGVQNKKDIGTLSTYADIIIAGSIFIKEIKNVNKRDIPKIITKKVKTFCRPRSTAWSRK